MAIFISPDGMSVWSARESRPDLLQAGYRLYVEPKPDDPIPDVEADPSVKAGDAEPSDEAEGRVSEPPPDHRIDINSATVELMMEGLGLLIAKAKAIEQGRPYADISELSRVKGLDVAPLIGKVKV
jgi:Helix-hairpin-helix motif